MATLLLWTAIALNAPKVEVTEEWNGTLVTEFVTAKPKKGRGTRKANTKSVSLTIKRNGKQFVGVWTEDQRTLEVAGTIDRKQFMARATRPLRGKWYDDVLKTFAIKGVIDKDVMVGELYGVGSKRARAGQFELTRKP
jgi:hypothetical protein